MLSGEGNGYGYGHERVGATVPGRVGAAAGVGQLGIRIPRLKLLSSPPRQEERLTYLAGLLHNTVDAIVAFNAEWVISVWNAGAEHL